MGAAKSKVSSFPSNRVIRVNLSIEQLIARTRRQPANVLTVDSAVETKSTASDSHDAKVELMDMQRQMVENVQRMENVEDVKFLNESTSAFEATASSYRPKSSQPVPLPTDKTLGASSTGAGRADEEKVSGRLTARDLRTLLRLHYEKPQSWTHDVLADKFELDVAIVRSILNSVSPPNILQPKGTLEHPRGVWFDAPGRSNSICS